MRVIASDVDGTLLRSDHTVGPRTRAALRAALDAGWLVVPVSGRQPFSIADVLGPLPRSPYTVGSNGAVGLNDRTGQILFEQTIGVDAQWAFFERLRADIPGVVAASVRDAGHTFVAEADYLRLMSPGDHGRQLERLAAFPLDEVMGAPSLKLVVRHPDLSESALLAAARELAFPGVHPSTSGAPFLEVAAGGVTKASGLALLGEALGFGPTDVVAFGDNLNDVEMLAWAGYGVAMGNGEPDAKAVADEVVASNDDEGVADVIERLLNTPDGRWSS